jgi:uncharacterized protein DUF6527
MKVKVWHGYLMFECPGCATVPQIVEGPSARHRIKVEGEYAWGWNGSLDAPTITPSILFQWYHKGDPPIDARCHSFIKDGQIEFLSDCTHALAGKTVLLPEMSEGLTD